MFIYQANVLSYRESNCRRKCLQDGTDQANIFASWEDAKRRLFIRVVIVSFWDGVCRGSMECWGAERLTGGSDAAADTTCGLPTLCLSRCYVLCVSLSPLRGVMSCSICVYYFMCNLFLCLLLLFFNSRTLIYLYLLFFFAFFFSLEISFWFIDINIFLFHEQVWSTKTRSFLIFLHTQS